MMTVGYVKTETHRLPLGSSFDVVVLQYILRRPSTSAESLECLKLLSVPVSVPAPEDGCDSCSLSLATVCTGTTYAELSQSVPVRVDFLRCSQSSLGQMTPGFVRTCGEPRKVDFYQPCSPYDCSSKKTLLATGTFAIIRNCQSSLSVNGNYVVSDSAVKQSSS
jgi:hypothetical protein